MTVGKNFIVRMSESKQSDDNANGVCAAHKEQMENHMANNFESANEACGKWPGREMC